MSYTVYKHTSPSGKVYIGVTCQPTARRWQNGAGYKHSPHFHAAIQKYGWDNIRHEIIAEGLTKEAAERMEIELIKQHCATDRDYGYNTDNGGSTGPKHTPETKARIGEANRSRKWSNESREKLRTYKKNNPTRPETVRKIAAANTGRKHRPESIEKIRNAQIKKTVRNVTTGKTYASVTGAARACGLNASGITKACKGKRRTCGGFVWDYEEVML